MVMPGTFDFFLGMALHTVWLHLIFLSREEIAGYSPVGCQYPVTESTIYSVDFTSIAFTITVPASKPKWWIQIDLFYCLKSFSFMTVGISLS